MNTAKATYWCISIGQKKTMSSKVDSNNIMSCGNPVDIIQFEKINWEGILIPKQSSELCSYLNLVRDQKGLNELT